MFCELTTQQCKQTLGESNAHKCVDAASDTDFSNEYCIRIGGREKEKESAHKEQDGPHESS